MATFLLVTWAGGGNVTPAVALTGALTGRDHRVALVAAESLATRFTSAGGELVGHPDGWLATAADVLAAIDATDPDVLIVDYMLTGALCGAERSGRPTAALVHTLYGEIERDGAPDPIEMAGSVDDVNGWRAALDLPPITRFADLLHACDRVLVTAPEQLDQPPSAAAPAPTYTGPLLEAPDERGWVPPPGDGPLVVVSLGTAGRDPAKETEVLARIAGAIDAVGARGLITVPSWIEHDAIGAPSGVVVDGFVPHPAVLPHADLVVTHAGLGTVTAALAHGLRMVCLPLDREQPANARAVERLGAGVALDPESEVDVIRDAIAAELARSRPDPIPVDPAVAVAALESLVR